VAALMMELGLTPAPGDPLQELRDQLAEQQLRAQLRVAQQIAPSTTTPVVVSVTQSLAG
jgi:hypothetical protein